MALDFAIHRAENKGALPPCISPGIFRFDAKAGGFMIRSAVTEDRALQGCNLSAGDGPKLAGVASGLPLPVTLRETAR